MWERRHTSLKTEQSVVFVIGVNGVGKTTTIGKLAGKLKESGEKGCFGGGRYISCSGGRTAYENGQTVPDVDMIGGQEGADPAAVVYDAVAAAKARNADVLTVRYGRTTSQ